MADKTVVMERLIAKNYGCLKDVDVKLTQLHAFIGPNDSGKSTILRAARVLQHVVQNGFSTNGIVYVSPFSPGFSSFGQENYIQCDFRNDYQIRVWASPNARLNAVVLQSNQGVFLDETLGNFIEAAKRGNVNPSVLSMLEKLRGATLIHFDAKALGKKGPLIPSGQRLLLSGESGDGLASIYDAIMSRNVEGFMEIQDKARLLFPTLRKIQLTTASNYEKQLEIELQNGNRVPVEFVSEGLLIYLAFAALPYLDPVSLILVEEPENGLHPARIRDVMRILREISKQTQVLIATHSPLVVNELEPDEVSIVTRNVDTGTVVTPINTTPGFEARYKTYALGELWLSYANGDDEGPLLRGEPRT